MGICQPLAVPGTTAAKRRRLETVIEIAIALLDAIDGDEDLEETGDLEPYLGWVGAGPGRCLDDGDREAEDEHGGAVDDEPHDDDELDRCDGYFDEPGFIPGGNEGADLFSNKLP